MRSSQLASFVSVAISMAGVLGCTGNASNQAGTSSPESVEADSSAAPELSPTPQSTTQSGSMLIRSGPFVDGEHPTKGTAQLVKQNDQHRVELDQAFATSTSGPDLVVVLHRSADVIGSTTPPAYPINEGDYVLLAPLKSFEGAQSYSIPASINLEEFQSVAIWCRRFNATFGSAFLQ